MRKELVFSRLGIRVLEIKGSLVVVILCGYLIIKFRLFLYFRKKYFGGYMFGLTWFGLTLRVGGSS